LFAVSIKREECGTYETCAKWRGRERANNNGGGSAWHEVRPGSEEDTVDDPGRGSKREASKLQVVGGGETLSPLFSLVFSLLSPQLLSFDDTGRKRV
jgi:hypothetical protein